MGTSWNAGKPSGFPLRSNCACMSRLMRSIKDASMGPSFEARVSSTLRLGASRLGVGQIAYCQQVFRGLPHLPVTVGQGRAEGGRHLG